MLTLAFLASDLRAEQVTFTRSSVNNSGGTVWGSISEAVEVGSVQHVTEPPFVQGDWRFTHWTVNGAPQRAVTGQAWTSFKWEVKGEAAVTAHYEDVAADMNANGIADWEEKRFYGGLLAAGTDPGYDWDGDSFGHAEERIRGSEPTIPDDPRDGGLTMRLSATSVFRDESVTKRFEIRSDPAGVIGGEIGYQVVGSERVTPSVPFGATAGYYFGFWEIDGVRQAAASGLALPQVTLTMDADHVAVARFFEAGDSDGDGLEDWQEWNWFGDLNFDGNSDPDGDGMGTALELTRGSEPTISDDLQDGGVMMRMSESAVLRDESLMKRYEIRSDPAGIVSAESGYLPTGSGKSTTTIGYGETAGFYFGFWEVDGVRQGLATGLALPQVTLTMDVDHVAVARFFVAGDADGDGLEDWQEWNWFGDLSLDGDSDPDGDGISTAVELVRGSEPHLFDDLADGGVMMRMSETAVLRDQTLKKRYEIRSDPAGIVSAESGYLTVGSEKITPTITYGVTQGFYFGYWEVDGVRQALLSGQALPQVTLALDADHVAVARFFPAGDEDGDGLEDWREWNWFGDLSLDGSSDPDGDGMSTSEELFRGSEPHLPDDLVDGGITMRMSGTAVLKKYFVPVTDVLVEGVLEQRFAQIPFQLVNRLRLGHLWEGAPAVVDVEQYPALGDWDGDGDYELFIYRTDRVLEASENIGSSFVVNLANRSEQFTTVAGTISGLPDEMLGVSLGDWDSDGDEDLIFAYNTGGIPPAGELLILDSPGSFAGPVPPNTALVILPSVSPLQYRAAALGDLNGDGLADLVAGVGDGTATTELRVYVRDPATGFGSVPDAVLDLSGAMSGREHVSLSISRGVDPAGRHLIYAASLYGQIFRLAYESTMQQLTVERTDWAASYPGFAQVPRIAVEDWDGDGDDDLVTSFVDMDGDEFVARAGDGAGEGIPFRSRLLRSNDPRLAPPFELKATNGARSILVEWVPNREYQLDGYFIYRGLSATGPWARIQAVSTEQRHFVDRDASLLGGVDYYYQVTAITRVWSPGSSLPALYEGPPSVSNAARVESALFALGEPARHDSGTIILPVTAEYGADISGAGMELRFGYNKTLLTPSLIETAAASKDLIYTSNLGVADGEIVITGTGGSLRGAGLIFLIHFDEVSPAQPSTPMRTPPLGDPIPMDGPPVGIPDGIFTLNVVAIRDINNQVLVPSPPVEVELWLVQMGLSGDINYDGVVNQEDIPALVSRIIQGRRDPSSVATSLPIADLNGSDILDVGDIPALYRRIAQGTPPEAEPDAPEYEITTSERTGQAGTHVTVPLAINDADGLSAVYLQINYDPNLLAFQDALRPAGSLGANFESVYGEADGVIYVVLYRDSSLAGGAGTLVDLDFEVNGGARPGMAADVVVADVGLTSDSGALAWWNSTVDQGKTRMWVTLSRLVDADGDGVSDYDEQLANGSPDYDPYDAVRNPFGRDLIYDSADSDGDGFLDGWEQRYGYNTFSPESLWVDTDGDGILDFYEQALGSDPLKWDQAPVRFSMHEVGGVNYPGVTYRRLKNPPAGVSYLHEVSDDLETWLSGAGFTEEMQVTPFDGLYDEVHTRDTRAPIGSGFSRVRVERP